MHKWVVTSDRVLRGDKSDMNSTFAFERNRYYSGKMLTSSDFEAEQTYMNGKRNFLNHMIYGSGIVCGLNVNNIDDLSVMIESGVAIDQDGHEIVVGSSIVKKLSAIDGFEELESNSARLVLKYREEETMPVYSVEKSGAANRYENNRVTEKYDLVLVDSDQGKKSRLDSFVRSVPFLENPDYEVYIQIPSIVCMGYLVRLTVNVKKVSDRNVPLSFDGVLQLPVMTTENGEHELAIGTHEIRLNKNEELNTDYWIYCDQTEITSTEILLRNHSSHASVGEYEVRTEEKLAIPIEVSHKDPSYVSREVGARPTLSELTNASQDGVELCEFLLLKTEGAYIIDEIINEGVRRYIPTIAADAVRREYEHHFREERSDHGDMKASSGVSDSRGQLFYQPNRFTSGTIEVPLKPDMKRNEVCFSEEIMHGLGKGDVYVEVGLSHFDDEGQMNAQEKRTVFGDMSIFEDSGSVSMSLGVEVFNNRGSFRVGVKLLGEQKSIIATVYWIAVKVMPIEERLKETEENQSISPEIPTVRMVARDSFFFNVRFNNMKPMRLTYELTESGSGEITADGIYTAPIKEGVYEIHIYCTDLPEISTYAYAIVSRGMASEKDEEAIREAAGV